MLRDLNPAWERVLGWSIEELTSRPFLDFVHPDDVDATAAVAGGLIENDCQTVSFENRYRAKDGSYRWLLWTSRSSAEDQLLYATAHDITDRKRGELPGGLVLAEGFGVTERHEAWWREEPRVSRSTRDSARETAR